MATFDWTVVVTWIVGFVITFWFFPNVDMFWELFPETWFAGENGKRDIILLSIAISLVPVLNIIAALLVMFHLFTYVEPDDRTPVLPGE